MALGGGYFLMQDKILPGTYINFVSARAGTQEPAARGNVAMGLELDWGKEGEVFSVTLDDAMKNAQELFGYPYNHEKMKGIRDIFRNATLLHAYRVNAGGTKASNSIAEALYSGTRGNDLKVSIQTNVDDEESFDVQTILDSTVVDFQTAKTFSELKPNAYVKWKGSGALSVTAATALTSGTNGTTTGESHQGFLDKIESYFFNAIGVVTTDDDVKTLYCNFAKRMREEMGIKFQAVVYKKAADYEGVVNVKNKTTDADWNEASAVYWATGAIAGAEISKSNTNKLYDGEFTIATDYTQIQLEAAIKAGEFTFHQVNDDVRVLVDVNSLVTTTDEKGEVFKENMTIRIIDDIATQTATLFNTKYIGKIINNESGRVSLWADIISYLTGLQEQGALTFNQEDVIVSAGEDRKSVVASIAIEVAGTMEKLYMTCVVG